MEIMWLRFSGCYGFLSVAVFWRHACGKLLFWKYVHVFEKLPFFVSVWFIVVNLCFLSSPNNMLTSLKTCSSFTTVWLPHNFILTKLWTWTLFREVVHFIMLFVTVSVLVFMVSMETERMPDVFFWFHMASNLVDYFSVTLLEYHGPWLQNLCLILSERCQVLIIFTTFF